MAEWVEPKTNWQPNSGVGAADLNRIESNIQVVYDMAKNEPSTVIGAARQTVNTTGTVLPAHECREVLLQNLSTNTQSIFYGKDSAGAIMELIPTGSVSIPVANTNLIYVKTTTGTASLNYLWRE